jgi:ribosomal protein S18 acetylase RimI-like enzyme
MLKIRRMTIQDIPFGMYLKDQSGWNQTQADWRRLLNMEPPGSFVAEWNSQPVGTVATCIFDSVAWIAMVLVDAAFRGRGVARAMLQEAMTYLKHQNVRTVRLDSTALGQPIYEQMGFIGQYTLTRFEGTARASAEPCPQVETAAPTDHDALCQFDQQTTGADRRKLLRQLFSENPNELQVVRSQSGIAGFLTGRPGTRAFQIGPCLAKPEAGEALFLDVAARHAGQFVFIDIPDDNPPAVSHALHLGLAPSRKFLRMSWGEPIRERINELWASSGPEKG